MVNYTVKKALRILEPRRTKERKEDSDVVVPFSKKLQVLDPSHELRQQRLGPSKAATAAATSSSSSSKHGMSSKHNYYTHPAARHSNPELQTVPRKWSSTASVSSLDAASVASVAVTLPNVDTVDDDLDMLEYNGLPRDSPVRRQSTGSSRAKSQQKLAKILGWNTSVQQWKTPRPSQSTETLVSPASTIKSPFSRNSPASWASDMSDVSTAESVTTVPKRKKSSGHRSNSVKSTASKAEHQPYDYQMRQFLSARPYTDFEQSRARHSPDLEHSPHRSHSPHIGFHYRQNSNPNVHKPLPTTPAFPTFPVVHPLSQSSLSSSPFPPPLVTPISRDDEDYSPIMELSAEEASVLLSQPEPTELPTEAIIDRAELPGIDSVEAAAGRLRSKSPTQLCNGNTQSVVNDFGPGHTLSVIEEEPWTTEELAKAYVYELPAQRRPGNLVGAEGPSCPGLSPSSSMSSRKLRLRDSESDAQLEEQADVRDGSEVTPTRTTPEPGTEPTDTDDEDDDNEGEGEEIIVIYDHRVKSHAGDMNGRSFLSLDDDTEGDETDTEETVRRSYRSSLRNSTRNSLRGWPLLDGEERRNRRTSAETTKTAYTTNTERTLFDPDFTGDLAKNPEWV